MSKSDQSKVKDQANTQIATNNANASATNETLQSILGEARGTAATSSSGALAGYSDIAATGGYDPAILGRINTGYEDLATTGGISEADATATRSRATQAAQSTYDTARDQATRTAAATGGYGNTSAVLGNLARKGSQAASDAAVSSDASLVSLKQQGKEAGLSGLSTTQQNLTSNKLSANAGLTNIYGLSESEVSSTVSSILQNYKQTGELNNQDLSILTNLANQPGVFDKIVSTIGTLGGTAAGVIGAVKGAVKGTS